MSDSVIEQEIQAKDLNAPRIRPADIEANIASEHYFTAADGVAASTQVSDGAPAYTPNDVPAGLKLLTFCVLTLRNGFTVTGESACASPENFDAEIGRRIARDNAVAKVWPLMGYELKRRLHDSATPGRADDEFQHFLSYSGLSGQSSDVLDKLRLAFDAGR